MKALQRLGWVPMMGMALAFACVLVFLYVKTQAYDSSDYFRKIAALRQIKQLDAHWELDVLKSKIGLNANYDPLVDPLNDLNKQRELLETVNVEQLDAAPGVWANNLETYEKAVQEKTALIERFKSHNAVLRNSLTFLPTAADDIQKLVSLAKGGDQAELKRVSTGVHEILLNSLVYSQATSDSKAVEIAVALNRLAIGSEDLPDDLREGLDIFSAHARTTLREQLSVNGLLDDIAAVPVAAHIDGLNDILSQGQQHAAAHVNQYRQYLLIFSSVLAGLLLWVASRLIRSYAVINRFNRQLQEANEGLEHRVQERTAELQDTRSELVTAARKAGMAEIATSVLHNVGNVLNSVNISADLVSRRIRASKAKGLAKAVQLINEHAADLGDFMTRDEKGKMLPGYLNQLVEALVVEQQSIVEELGQLTGNIDHIKDIVSTQQSYAGVSSVVEPLRITDVIDDALRIQAGSLTHHQITVVKDYADVPVLLLDKHKLLLILVNLISNAKNAMDGLVDQTRKMTLSVTVADERTLQVCVKDEGEGIAPENFTRMFSHGFTTRKDGHGFGLHSCAVAAKEMAGTLKAFSDGLGKGAIFMLELPYRGVEAL